MTKSCLILGNIPADVNSPTILKLDSISYYKRCAKHKNLERGDAKIDLENMYR